MMDSLCAIISKTGVSDSGAAARMSLHPSTLSRWKRENPDLAILLRGAREDFREAQLAIIMDIAHSGRGSSLRAATWLLERVFPQDYAPRAKERAQFQERFDAICAAEEEGSVLEGPAQGEELQNVKNPAALAAPAPAPAPELTSPLTPVDRSAKAFPLPEKPLQNVKNSPLAGPLCPPAMSTSTVQE